MKFTEESIKNFFARKDVQYSIPTYQRAYSWEEHQIRTFLEDLKEHKETKIYHYGNILLEETAQDRYDIIDGQQRITTLSIFMRCLLNAFKQKGSESFATKDGRQIKITTAEEDYFCADGVAKLVLVQYDRAFFEDQIIYDKHTLSAETPSQVKILSAKIFFTEELSKLAEMELVGIYETVRAAKINRIELSGKREAALMFELQNNRGKDLTNLERLKSFLMYHLYVYSKQADSDIVYVSDLFNKIYLHISEISSILNVNIDKEDDRSSNISEDSILLYHSYAYNQRHFAYRNLNDIFEDFKSMSNKNKAEWIKTYTTSLYTSFVNMKVLLQQYDQELNNLKKMKIPFFVYPFLIKGFQRLTNDKKLKQKMTHLLRLMEVLSFRYKLINSRADIRSRLNELIKTFDGNIEDLAKNMKVKMEEAYYWSDKKFREVLSGNMFKNNMINYFLWQYEDSIQGPGYQIKSGIKIADESIEHISPQTEPKEKVNHGYEIDSITGYYTDSFRENYMNKLGNLMLISKKHNSSIGNKPFEEKLQSYKTTSLLKQQIEIEKIVNDVNEAGRNPVWNSKCIDKRQDKMLEFACARWSFDIKL